MSVTSLQTKQGVILLQSSDASIGIATTGNNINLIANKTGSQGGVTSLNTLTGACLLTSLGNTIGITEATPFPGGHTINLEAIGGGGGAGVGTINLQGPINGNMSIIGSGSVSVGAGASNQIVITGTDTAGVPSVQQNSGIIITGAVQLVSGTNITMNDSGPGAITINASGDGAGIETINGVSPNIGEFGINAGSGISVVNQTNAIQIQNSGVLAISDINNGIQLTGVVNIVGKTGIGTSIGGTSGQDINIDNEGVLGIIPNANDPGHPPPLVGNIGLIAGSNITLTEAGQNITITSTGDGAGIETINGISGGAGGAFLINAGTAITITPDALTNSIEIINGGVVSVATGINAPATGAISLVAGANVTITEASVGAFTIASSGGGGGGIQTISGIPPTALGEWTLDNGTGIGYTQLPAPQAGIQLTNSGVLSVTGGGNTYTGAVSLIAGGGITISNPSAHQFEITNTGSGATYSYTNNQPYAMTDVDNYFVGVQTPTYSVSNRSLKQFVVADFNTTSNAFTFQTAEHPVSPTTATTLICGNSTQTIYITANVFSPVPLGGDVTYQVYNTATGALVSNSTCFNGFGEVDIYAVCADDTYFYLVTNNPAAGSINICPFLISNGLSSTNNSTNLFMYQVGSLTSVGITNFISQTFSWQTYLSLGGAFDYTDLSSQPTNQTLIYMAVVTGATGTITPSYNVPFLNSNHINRGGIWIDATDIMIAATDTANNTNSIARFYIPTNSFTGNFGFPFTSGVNMSLRTSTNAGGNVIICLDNTVASTFSYIQYSTVVPLSGTPTIISLPNNDYVFHQYSASSGNLGNINFNSSIFDNNYTYQASAETTLTFANSLASGAEANVTFQVPYGASVMPSLYFPISARNISTNTARVNMRGSTTSFSGGLATINIAIYNESTVATTAGDIIHLIPSQFTLMPTS
jgi:hypothetical protein